MSKVTEYLATIILPSLLVDEVKNVIGNNLESIYELNKHILEIKHKCYDEHCKRLDKMNRDINISIIERALFQKEILKFVYSNLYFRNFVINNKWEISKLFKLGYMGE